MSSSLVSELALVVVDVEMFEVDVDGIARVDSSGSLVEHGIDIDAMPAAVALGLQPEFVPLRMTKFRFSSSAFPLKNGSPHLDLYFADFEQDCSDFQKHCFAHLLPHLAYVLYLLCGKRCIHLKSIAFF